MAHCHPTKTMHRKRHHHELDPGHIQNDKSSDERLYLYGAPRGAAYPPNSSLCVGGTSACATGHTSSSTFLSMPSPVSHIGDRFLHGVLTQDVGILPLEYYQGLSTPACSSGLFNDWIRQVSLALQADTDSRYDNATLNHDWTRVLSSTHPSIAILLDVQS